MIPFLSYRKWYFGLSALVISAGIFSMIRWGFVYSIDFVGGTNISYRLNSAVSESEVRSLIEKEGAEIVTIRVDGEYVEARLKAIDEPTEEAIKTGLADKGGSVTVLISETVGPTLGREMLYKTLIAAGLSILVILSYMTYSFQNVRFAASAIAALFHDLLVVFGSYSLLSHFFGAEIDTMFVTAVLISLAISVHDTIIIFDKVREYMKHEGMPLNAKTINTALTATLVRSFNNSITTIFMLLALALLGGDIIRFFVITLLIGTVTGTYSSPFIAAPILDIFTTRFGKK